MNLEYFSRARSWLASAITYNDVLLLSALVALAAHTLWPDRVVAANAPSDAADYALQSLNFVQGKGMVIIVNGHKYPPSHPFGLPLLLAPAYAVLGPSIANGIYVVFMMGLGSVVLLYFLARLLFDRKVAFVASLFLIVAPDFAYNAKLIQADVASMFLVLAALLILLVLLGNPRSSLWLWALLGQILGYAITVRPDNVLTLLGFGLLVLKCLKGQQRLFAKAVILVTGVVLWWAAVLVTNFLYTGDCFRTGYHVNVSAVYDRPGGCVSWHYFGQPSFRESNLYRYLCNAQYQWVLDETARVKNLAKRCFYYISDVLLLLGVAKLLWCRGGTTRVRDFLITALLCPTILLVFFSCFDYSTSDRYLLRIVPYLCIFDAVGLVAVLDYLSKLGSRLQLANRAFSESRDNVWLSMCCRSLRIMVIVGMASLGAYMLLNPYHNVFSYVPQVEYLEHIAHRIPENDAVIISNFQFYYVDHFLIGDSQRRLILLHREQLGGAFSLQWKRPPHPEWIAEDIPFGNRMLRYRRMYDNGAQDMFPHTVLEHPEVIDQALLEGRSVYLIYAGGFRLADRETVAMLQKRYKLVTLGRGFFPPDCILPELSQFFAAKFSIFRLAL